MKLSHSVWKNTGLGRGCGLAGRLNRRPQARLHSANLHNAVTISRERAGKRACSLSAERMDEICVRELLDLWLETYQTSRSFRKRGIVELDLR
jgi:hypothetical protein